MNYNITINSTQVSRLTQQLHWRKDGAILAGHRAVQDTANEIFSISQTRIHRRTGALANSGKVVHEQRNNAAVSIIGYGDSTINPVSGVATADYAVASHESPSGGKWLENASLDCATVFRTKLQSNISRALSQ